MSNKSIILKKGREESLKRFHPWIFSGAIHKSSKGLADGDIVDIYSASGDFCGSGHYQIGSIAVRMLSFDNECHNDDFWDIRLTKALQMRQNLSLEADCYRLIHGEGDMLPGLIIDFYSGVAVIQAHTAGMYLSIPSISQALKRVYGEKLVAIYNKSEATAPFKAGLELKDGYIFGGVDSQEMVVKENGHSFIVNWEEGQKTGFFLDQRDNRALLKKYSKGKSVLNLFCYTGGFSVYALAGEAKRVVSVDSSKKAIDMAERNVAYNRSEGIIKSEAEHLSVCDDAIDYLKSIDGGEYDVIVVDPPAFAKHRGALQNALRAYQRLNACAIEKVKPGGLIFTYSCSQVVDKIQFAQALFSAAAQTGRRVKIIHRLTQPCDHPVNIYHPEGEYLKGLVLYVE